MNANSMSVEGAGYERGIRTVAGPSLSVCPPACWSTDHNRLLCCSSALPGPAVASADGCSLWRYLCCLVGFRGRLFTGKQSPAMRDGWLKCIVNLLPLCAVGPSFRCLALSCVPLLLILLCSENIPWAICNGVWKAAAFDFCFVVSRLRNSVERLISLFLVGKSDSLICVNNGSSSVRHQRQRICLISISRWHPNPTLSSSVVAHLWPSSSSHFVFNKHYKIAAPQTFQYHPWRGAIIYGAVHKSEWGTTKTHSVSHSGMSHSLLNSPESCKLSVQRHFLSIHPSLLIVFFFNY